MSTSSAHTNQRVKLFAVADPGFTRGGDVNCKPGGANLLFWPEKLHENENTFT